MKTTWNVVRWVGEALQSPFLLLIRLYWGYHFAVAGFTKFLSFGSTISYIQSLNFPFPIVNALLVSSAEAFCGSLLFLGLFSRLAAIPLIFSMSVAYFATEYDALVTLFTEFDPTPFFSKAPFLYLYTCILVFLFGPGKLSLDYLLMEKKGYKI